jgi:hypothetical protein
MQSNQSKLLIAGLVAAQVTASQIETTDNNTTLVAEHPDITQTLLAQIGDDEGTNIPKAPSNANTNTEEEEEERANEPSILDTTDLNEKIDLITDAAIGGLDSKKKFIIDKLQFYANEKLQQYMQIDESCR